jgi:hypothetical protein
VFTDPFEINDTTGVASTPPLLGCSAPQVLSGLTIYRGGINPPTDVDYYRYSLQAQRFLSVTVKPDPTNPAGTPDNLQLFVQIVDGTGINQLASGTTGVGSTSAALNLTAYALNATTYFVRVAALNPTTLTQSESKPYSLIVCQSDNAVPPTAPPPPTPAGAAPDVYDTPPRSNDLAQLALANQSFATVGVAVSNMNFYTSTLVNGQPPVGPEGDVDWYFFYGRKGSRYEIRTDVQPGVDTDMYLYLDKADGVAAGVIPPDGAPSPPDSNTSQVGLYAVNDDYAPVNRGSRILFEAPYEGKYWIKLWNKDRSPRIAGQTYTLVVNEQNTVTGTVTATIGPPPTPFPSGLDRFEYNGDFDSAGLIAPGVKYDQLNFVPFQPTAPNVVDNDFYRLPVKQGVYYTCETLDLAGGTDTNMIVYNQDRQGIGGNDDVSEADKALGKFGSRFTWLSGYNGFAYILVGDVNPPRANEGQTRTYSLLCVIGIPATPTPTPNPTPPTPTSPPASPLPPEPTATPFPTPRPAQPLVVQPVDPASLAPTVQPTPTPRVMMIDVQAFLDYSRNGLLDPGEGISGAPVRVYDEISGTPLGQAFTDGDGRVRFSITNEGPVRISLPAFGYSTVVDTSPATVRVGIVPSLELPERIP